ncbi:unnamed protein product [Larinioides sclopetarius]|uniref:Uncharacterized protein n=1 Tax=Larinioides sclopetarius TaxID=280406 RepID=A0AAV1YY94_9ARAC
MEQVSILPVLVTGIILLMVAVLFDGKINLCTALYLYLDLQYEQPF